MFRPGCMASEVPVGSPVSDIWRGWAFPQREAGGRKRPAGFTRSFEGSLFRGESGAEEKNRSGDPVWENL